MGWIRSDYNNVPEMFGKGNKGKGSKVKWKSGALAADNAAGRANDQKRNDRAEKARQKAIDAEEKRQAEAKKVADQIKKDQKAAKKAAKAKAKGALEDGTLIP